MIFVWSFHQHKSSSENLTHKVGSPVPNNIFPYTSIPDHAYGVQISYHLDQSIIGLFEFFFNKLVFLSCFYKTVCIF